VDGLKETDWESYPTCPKCGIADPEWWDGSPMKGDGDTEEIECSDEDCGHKYYVAMCVDVTFQSKSLGDPVVHILYNGQGRCYKSWPDTWIQDTWIGSNEDEAKIRAEATCEKCIERWNKDKDPFKKWRSEDAKAHQG